MKTTVTIKLKLDDPQDVAYDIPGYFNAIRTLIEQNVEDVTVRGLIDFGAIKKGEPPTFIAEDEEPAQALTNPEVGQADVD